MTAENRSPAGAAARSGRTPSGGRVSALFSDFAAKKYSIPLFFAFAFFCLFVSAKIGGFNVLDITGDKNEAGMFLYLLDYRVGFTTRLLVGAVLGLFTDKITPTMIYRTAGLSVLVSFILHALLGGLVLRKSVAKKAYPIALLTLVFLLHSLTSLQNIRIKGCLDTYIYILFLLWLFFFDRYASVVTVPALCAVCMLIHYSYIFTFMPPVLALMVYGLVFAEKRVKRVLCGVSFAVGGAAVLGLFFYFVFFANDHLKMTREELYAYMESKYELTVMEEIHMRRIFGGNLFFRDYLDVYLFNRDLFTEEFGNANNALGYIRTGVRNYVGLSVYLKYISLFLPLYAVFAALWGACMKKARGLKKLPFIVFIGMPVTLLPAFYMSTDVWRWTSASIISQLCVLFALYRIEDAALMEVVHCETLRKRPVKIALGVLCAAYIAYALWFGMDLPIVL